MLLAGQPSANWFQEHITDWSGSLSIDGLVDDLRTYLGVLAFGLGLVFGFTFDTAGPQPAAPGARRLQGTGTRARRPRRLLEPSAEPAPEPPVTEPEGSPSAQG